MNTNLESIEQRVSVLLLDLTRLNFSTQLIDEGIRLALKEYSLASGQVETLAGLDEAGLTSIPEQDCGLLVLGAAGYVAAAKTLDRKEQFNLVDQLPEAVTNLGSRLLMRFDRLLGYVRSARMRAADVTPWGDGWPLAI
jgi:hypothetical protein